MGDLPEDKRRAVEPYLKFLRRLDEDVDLDTRVWHILYEMTASDFDELAVTLSDLDQTAGFSVPAVHLDGAASRAGAVSRLDDAGHEILLHGYRHTSFLDTSYDRAHEELSRAAEVIESVTGSRPNGFHVPYAAASDGTLRAAADLGVDWVVGARASDSVADGTADLSVLEPASPYDLQLLERDLDAKTAFARVGEDTANPDLYLLHPNIHLMSDATEAFAAWLEERSLAGPGAVAANETSAPGLLLDCFPPFQVA